MDFKSIDELNAYLDAQQQAGTTEPQGPRRELTVGEQLDYGRDAETGGFGTEDSTVSNVIGVTPLAWREQKRYANSWREALLDMQKTGTTDKLEDASYRWYNPFTWDVMKPITKALGGASSFADGVNQEIENWENTEGKLYDYAGKVYRGEIVPVDETGALSLPEGYEGLYERRMNADGQYERTGSLRRKYLTPHDQAKKRFVAELGNRMLGENLGIANKAREQLELDTSDAIDKAAAFIVGNAGMMGEFAASKLLTGGVPIIPIVGEVASRWSDLRSNDLDVDNDGNVYLVAEADDPLDAAWKTAAGAGINVGVEMLGGVAAGVGLKALKFAAKPAQYVLGAAVRKGLSPMVKKVSGAVPSFAKFFSKSNTAVSPATKDAVLTLMRGVKDVNKVVQFHEFPGEVLEEAGQGYADEVWGFGRKDSQGAITGAEFMKDFLSEDNFPDLVVGILANQLALGGVGVAKGGYDYGRRVERSKEGLVRTELVNRDEIGGLNTREREGLMRMTTGGLDYDGARETLIDLGADATALDGMDRRKVTALGNFFAERFEGKDTLARVATAKELLGVLNGRVAEVANLMNERMGVGTDVRALSQYDGTVDFDMDNARRDDEGNLIAEDVNGLGIRIVNVKGEGKEFLVTNEDGETFKTRKTGFAYSAKTPEQAMAWARRAAQRVRQQNDITKAKNEAVMSAATRLMGKSRFSVYRNMDDYLKAHPERKGNFKADDFENGGFINLSGETPEVSFILDNIDSPAEVVNLMLHENGLHGGIRGVFGMNGMKQVLQKIGKADMIKKARTEGVNGGTAIDALYKENNLTDEQLVEEAAAAIQENRLSDPNTYNLFVYEVRELLRKTFKNMGYNDSDVKVILSQARKLAREGGRGENIVRNEFAYDPNARATARSMQPPQAVQQESAREATSAPQEIPYSMQPPAPRLVSNPVKHWKDYERDAWEPEKDGDSETATEPTEPTQPTDSPVGVAERTVTRPNVTEPGVNSYPEWQKELASVMVDNPENDAYAKLVGLTEEENTAAISRPQAELPLEAQRQQDTAVPPVEQSSEVPAATDATSILSDPAAALRARMGDEAFDAYEQKLQNKFDAMAEKESGDAMMARVKKDNDKNVKMGKRKISMSKLPKKYAAYANKKKRELLTGYMRDAMFEQLVADGVVTQEDVAAFKQGKINDRRAARNTSDHKNKGMIKPAQESAPAQAATTTTEASADDRAFLDDEGNDIRKRKMSSYQSKLFGVMASRMLPKVDGNVAKPSAEERTEAINDPVAGITKLAEKTGTQDRLKETLSFLETRGKDLPLVMSVGSLVGTGNYKLKDFPAETQKLYWSFLDNINAKVKAKKPSVVLTKDGTVSRAAAKDNADDEVMWAKKDRKRKDVQELKLNSGITLKVRRDERGNLVTVADDENRTPPTKADFDQYRMAEDAYKEAIASGDADKLKEASGNLMDSLANIANKRGFPLHLFKGVKNYSGYRTIDETKSDTGKFVYFSDREPVSRSYAYDNGVRALREDLEAKGLRLSPILQDMKSLKEMVRSMALNAVDDASLIEDDIDSLFEAELALGGETSRDSLQEYDQALENIVMNIGDLDVADQILNTSFQANEILQEYYHNGGGNGNALTLSMFAKVPNFIVLDAKNKAWTDLEFLNPELTSDEVEKINKIFDDIESGEYNGDDGDVMSILPRSVSSTDTIAEYYADEGIYDGVIFLNVNDSDAAAEEGVIGNDFVFFRPKRQTKSADFETFDENLEKIPIEKRYDDSKDDFMFAKKDKRTQTNHIEEFNSITLADDDTIESVDAAYNTALENGDEEEAFKQVVKAAKLAGYDTRTFHGTDSFGFTTIDTKKGDQGLAFYATSLLGMAKSYANNKDIREVNDTEDLDKEEQEVKTEISNLKDQQKKLLNQYFKSLYSVSDNIASKFLEKIEYIIEDWGDWLDDLNIVLPKKSSIEGIVKGSIRTAEIAEDMSQKDIFSVLMGSWIGIENEISRLNPNLNSDDFVLGENFEASDFYKEDFMRNASEYMDTVDDISSVIMNKEIRLMRGFHKSSVYDFAFNTARFVTIDANGSGWRNIQFEGAKHSTRSLEKLFANRRKSDPSIRGVHIKNVRDYGMYVDDTPPGDIFISYFPQEDVKSLDVETFDANNNRIPLSERFDASNDDIRWARKDRRRAPVPPEKSISATEAARKIITEDKRGWEDLKGIGTTIRRKLQDAMIDIKNFEERLGVKTADSFYYAADRVHGHDEWESKKLDRDFIEPIYKALNEADIKEDDFDMFLLAMGGKERNAMIAKKTKDEVKDGSGLTDKQIDELIQGFKANGTYDKMLPIAKQVWEMNFKSLDHLVESGRLAKAQADYWKKNSPHYVPYRTDMTEEGNVLVGEGSRSYTIREYKQARGRKTLADNPLRFSILQASQAIHRANDNDARKKLAKIIADHPKYGTIFSAEKSNVPDYRTIDNIVPFKEDGVLKWMDLSTTDDFDGKIIGKAAKKASFANLGVVQKGLEKVTRLFSMLRTSLSPEFVVTNALADDGQCLRNISSTFGAKGAADFQGNVPYAYMAALRLNGNKPMNATGKMGEMEKYAQEWAENGGMIGGFVMSGLSEVNEKLEKEIALTANKGRLPPKLWARKIAKLAEDFNAPVEMSMRIATYATCRKQGMSVEDAISYSRDVTVNFNRKGEWSPVMNSLYAFSNAAIQGIHRSGVAAGAGRYGVQMMSTMTFLALAAYLWNAAGDDDEDAKKGLPQWKDTADYVKDNNLCFRIGDQFVKIPVRGFDRIPVKIANSIAKVMLGGDAVEEAKNVGDFALSAIFDPIGNAPTMAQRITPSFVRPAVELMQNKSFTGSQIYRESPDKYAVKSEIGRGSTGSFWHGLARLVNTATGGNASKSGAMDYQPEAYRHVWQWLTGSAGADVVRYASAIPDAAKGRLKWGNMPFARRVVSDLGENTSEYHKLRDQFKIAEKEVEGAIATDNDEVYNKATAESPFMQKKNQRWFKQLDDTEKMVRKLSQMEARTRDDNERDEIKKLRMIAQYNFIKMMEASPYSKEFTGGNSVNEIRRGNSQIKRMTKRSDREKKRDEKKRRFDFFLKR